MKSYDRERKRESEREREEEGAKKKWSRAKVASHLPKYPWRQIGAAGWKGTVEQ